MRFKYTRVGLLCTPHFTAPESETMMTLGFTTSQGQHGQQPYKIPTIIYCEMAYGLYKVPPPGGEGMVPFSLKQTGVLDAMVCVL